MINSYILSKARYLVDKCGSKEILINNEVFIKQCNSVEMLNTILPSLSVELRHLADVNSIPIAPLVCVLWALYEKDVVDEQQIKTPEEYFHLIFSHEDAVEEIKFFYYNLNDYRFVDASTIEQDRKKILENSIAFFEEKFSSLRESGEYKKYQTELELQENKENTTKKDTSSQRSYDSIVEDLKNNKKDKKKSIVNWITYDSIMKGLKENIRSSEAITRTILETLKNMKMDFYIEHDSLKIYPLIVDMLDNLFMLEYFFYYKKSRTRPLTSAKVWPDIVEEYKEGGKSYTYLFFSQLVRIEEIGSRNIRPYFLAEYARTLNVDKEELRLLMQNIFFPIPENHKCSFGLNLNIDKIPPVPFFLEETKMVIGGI